MIPLNPLSNVIVDKTGNHNWTYQSSAYVDLAWAILKQLEGVKTLPYFDSRNIATIGVGFNLTVDSVRQKVETAIKLDPSLGVTYQGTAMTLNVAVPKAINDALKDVQAAQAQLLAGQQLSAAAKNQMLQSRLNSIINTSTSKAILFQIADTSDKEMRPIWDLVRAGPESALDNKVTVDPSRERAVLLSLMYNSPSLIGSGKKRGQVRRETGKE